MKFFAGLLVALFFCSHAMSQYYYKDIVATGQTMSKWTIYRKAGVKEVILHSLEHDGQPTPDFQCEQQVNSDFSRILTITSTTQNPRSVLAASYDARGLLKQTIDTSDTFQSTTNFQYDEQDHVVLVNNESLETDNGRKETEDHIWKYKDGKPVSMIKVKNGSDSTYITFVLDEKGNIAEEHAVRNNNTLPTIFYYYNNNHLLTDVVKFNERADRLLPDYVFEYDASNQLSSMLIVPEGGSDYLKWSYSYNDKGLPAKDFCYNKQRELVGQITYQYQYR